MTSGSKSRRRVRNAPLWIQDTSIHSGAVRPAQNQLERGRVLRAISYWSDHGAKPTRSLMHELFQNSVALNGLMPLGSWPLLIWFGEEYYYASASQAVCTLSQPIVVGIDTPSRYYSGLRLHNGCMGPNIVRVRRCSYLENQRRIFARYLVSMVSIYSPRKLRRGI